MSQKQQDAGTRHYDHYAATLPKWRYILRQWVLPLVRAETPPLAKMQSLARAPFLDSYFAFAANLGTHTFFMIFLPVLFWCGYNEYGRALVNLLAAGVIVSGIIKDILCLPRPMSPPLQRITMSGSAALEYGFPSTHTTNAMSVALYAIHILNSEAAEGLSPTARMAWVSTLYLYAFSIAFGRLYCGMHGFTDVVAGGLLGALITQVQIHFGERLYHWIIDGSILHPLIYMLVLFFTIRTHPEPADDCPCFDDSVAFSGVLIGVNWSYWRILQPHALLRLLLTRTTLEIQNAGVPLISWQTLIRIPLGVIIIVAYRSVTKPLLLRGLPPLFRVIEHLDLDLPRRYFLRASQYRTVPRLHRDDNVLPNPSDVGQMIGDVRRRRGRAISIGPQSMADAREVIAYRRDARRRERSLSAGGTTRNPAHTDARSRESSIEARLHRRTLSNESAFSLASAAEEDEEEGSDAEVAANERVAIFSAIPRIRIRYDVEVITKLIVYTGIGWWAVEGCIVVFECLGLGPARGLI
ncbi:PAP2 domain protein [Microthyrium microscopicum]|uniref:PAP2 domain protein n=1 Tax=Microthyrium microscopicum TaxID=703497 RepID=A0A6A6UK19_9PEZI|nr:PAP2 domain protein [Microthyrium microscopicum]